MHISARIAVALIAVLATAPAQSLWNPARPTPSSISDTTARNIGDVLMIVISERQTVQNTEKTEFTKEKTIDAAITNFDILENAFGTLPALAANGNRELTSDAKYDKEGRLQTRMSVLVIDVMPNGNMLVEGRRRIIVDRETKTIRFTGIVRPFDVTGANTILSEQVANASIAYEGEGPLTNTTNKGWLSELVDFVWPF